MLHDTHKVAPDALLPGKMALAAGLDMEAPTCSLGLNCSRAAVMTENCNSRSTGRSAYPADTFAWVCSKIRKALTEQLQSLRNAKALAISRQLAREHRLAEKMTATCCAERKWHCALIGPNARRMQLATTPTAMH